MRLDYIRPFTDASNEILQNYLKDGIKISDITLKGDFVNASGIIAIVALSEDYSWTFHHRHGIRNC